jgi:hypothetical protein
MAKKISLAVVCLFWLVMTGLLVRRQMESTADEVFYKKFVKMGLSDRDVVMDIYWNGKKTGESRTSHVLSESGGTILNEASLSIGGIGDVRISTMAQVDKNLALRHIVVNVEYGEKQIYAVGRADGDDLRVRITGLGSERDFRIPNSGAMAFASGPLPTLAIKNLRVGAEWDMPLFDFATMRPARARARVSDRQKIPWAGSLRNCYRIVVTDTRGRKMLMAWSDDEGRLLEMEFAGVKFVRRNDED